MKQTYAFCCNENEQLLLSTPVIAAGQALSHTSSDFDGSELSLGIRFKADDVTAGTILECYDTSTTDISWSLHIVLGELYFYSDEDSEIYLFDVSVDTIYHVWIDVDADDLDVYYQEEGGARNYSNIAISTITNADSAVYIGTNAALDDPLDGTLWDFAYSTAKNSSATTYIPGGCNLAWTYYWPMREGTGAVCADVIQGVGLTVTTGFSWTGDDIDDPKRWA
jgi:hypothetical protein